MIKIELTDHESSLLRTALIDISTQYSKLPNKQKYNGLEPIIDKLFLASIKLRKMVTKPKLSPYLGEQTY